MLHSRPRGDGFKPHRFHCVVYLSKNINPSLVLVLPRKTCPFTPERLWMGRKESNQTKKKNMTVLYPNPCYNEMCYKGTALNITTTFAAILKKSTSTITIADKINT